jgi:hypothetical protein
MSASVPIVYQSTFEKMDSNRLIRKDVKQLCIDFKAGKDDNIILSDEFCDACKVLSSID